MDFLSHGLIDTGHCVETAFNLGEALRGLKWLGFFDDRGRDVVGKRRKQSLRIGPCLSIVGRAPVDTMLPRSVFVTCLAIPASKQNSLEVSEVPVKIERSRLGRCVQ